MKKIFYIITIAGLCFSLTGCQKYLSEEGAPILSNDFYATEQGVNAAIDAAYSFMRYPVGEEYRMDMTDYGTDLWTAGGDGSQRDAFDGYQSSKLNASQNVITNVWDNTYKAIATCNVALAKIAASKDMTETVKSQAKGEVFFLRAYNYFDLVQQYGRIPLVTKASEEVVTTYERASIADVYKQIIADLDSAYTMLPESPAHKGKASKYVAANLLAKVYLTRGSAVTEQRGQESTDMANALKYAEEVIKCGQYSLETDFAKLFDINNQGNSEVIFAVQFTTNIVYNSKTSDNGGGNQNHLFYLSVYDDTDKDLLVRTIEYGRPFKRIRPTYKVYEQLYDRKNDSRFYKQFQFAYLCNNVNSKGYEIGDTVIYYGVDLNAVGTQGYEKFKSYADANYRKYYPYSNFKDQTKYYPTLIKHLDPNRSEVSLRQGGREWVRMRLGETYLIAAEAAARQEQYDKAATYINKLRERAAWKKDETKCQEYWLFEGGEKDDKNSTYDLIKVSEDDVHTPDVVTFMLDERAREMLGELNRWEDLVRCEKLVEWAKAFNPNAAANVKEFHKYRPIPQSFIDSLDPPGKTEELQNEGYY